MKFHTEHKYLSISFCAFGVIASSIILYMILNHIPYFVGVTEKVASILSPFIWGFAIAYVLNYPYRWFCKKFSNLKKKPSDGVIKVLSMVITYVISLLVLGAFIYFLAPQIINAIIGFADVIPTYVSQLRTGSFEIIANYLTRYNISTDELFNITNQFLEDITSNLDIQHIMSVIVNAILSFTVGLKNFLIGLIVSIYFLADKERFKRTGEKLVYVLFSKDTARRIFYVLKLTDKTFGSFVIANVLDSFIIGCLCYIGMIILSLKYPVLIAVIVGTTNIIPFFGPFIGAIPSALILFLSSPLQSLVFCIFILILQQFDGNILKPKLFGETLGIRAVFVIFAVLIGGGMFGVIGMFAGVPVFAVSYAILSAIMNKKYKQKYLSEEKNEL